MNKQNKLQKMTVGDIIFFSILIIAFVLIAFITIYPFWNLVVISFNLPYDYFQNGQLTFWPREWSLLNYQYYFDAESIGIIGIAAWNSISRTIFGTIINVFWGLLVSYALSRKYFVLRKFMNIFVVLPMYIGAGLIPTYILYDALGLTDNYLVYIIPNLTSAYNIIVLRTYMQDIPESLCEAAKIDGASEAGILFKVMLPLCMPCLATLLLFIAVFHWSAYTDTLYYITDFEKLQTLQYMMYSSVTTDRVPLSKKGYYTQSLSAAVTVIATIPIIIIYPFLQKYFVSGMTMGAVKE